MTLDASRISNEIRHIVRTAGARDDQRACVELARRIAADWELTGELRRKSITAAISNAGTQPYRRFGISVADFAEAILTSLSSQVGSPDLGAWIERFRAYAIRQLASDLGSRAEAPARALLQTFLAARYETFREVPTGRGRTDILVGSAHGEIIEVKMWRGQTYFDDGLDEVGDYMRTQEKGHAYYVVFDFNDRDRTPEQIDEERRTASAVVSIRWIVVPAVAPSKLGRRRRRSASV